MKKKGVLIIAIGSWYGRWASNLAASLKWNNDIPIALAHDAEALSHYSSKNLAQFDELIPIPEEYYHSYGLKHEVKTKLYMYDLSPFEETVYIDAENLLLPLTDIKELFRKSFTIQSRGEINVKDAAKNPNFIHWGAVEKYCKQFDLKSGKLYNLFSEYIYFKKNAKTKKIFETAKEVWKALEGSIRSFNMSVPDELCFMIAMNQNKITQEVYLPTYWETAERKGLRMGPELYKYKIYSMGGNTVTPPMKAIYQGNNSLTQMYCSKSGTIPYYAENKSRISAKRIQK